MKVEINEEEAKLLYPSASDSLKQELEDKFGKDFFIPKDYEKIVSFEAAVEKRPVDDDAIIYETDAPHIVVFKELCHITKVVNGDWEADIFNPEQKKWEPVFKASGSGFVFAYSCSSYDATHASVGSRLSYVSKEVSNFMGEQFLDKFKLFITNRK